MSDEYGRFNKAQLKVIHTRLLRHIAGLPSWDRDFVFNIAKTIEQLIESGIEEICFEGFINKKYLAVILAVCGSSFKEFGKYRKDLKEGFSEEKMLYEHHMNMTQWGVGDLPCLKAPRGSWCTEKVDHEGPCRIAHRKLPNQKFQTLGPLSCSDMAILITRLRARLDRTHGNLHLIKYLSDIGSSMRPISLRNTERNAILFAIPVDRGSSREGIPDTLYEALHHLSVQDTFMDKKLSDLENEVDRWNEENPIGTSFLWQSPFNTRATYQGVTEGPAYLFRGEPCISSQSRKFPIRDVKVLGRTEIDADLGVQT